MLLSMFSKHFCVTYIFIIYYAMQLYFRNVSKRSNETFLFANVKFFSYLCMRIEILESTITKITQNT